MLNPTKMVTDSHFQPADSRRNIWHCTVPSGTKKDDIFLPEFFSNVAGKVIVGDRIECVAEDGTFMMEVYVIAVADRTPTNAPNWVNVVELSYHNLVRKEDKDLKLPEGFFAKYRGGAKWSVIRKGETAAQDQVIVERQPTEGDAIREFNKMKNKLLVA